MRAKSDARKEIAFRRHDLGPDKGLIKVEVRGGPARWPKSNLSAKSCGLAALDLAEEAEMKRGLIAGLFITALATPAFAETFYVAFDPESHKCSLMHNQAPPSNMKVMGTYSSEAEAVKAMHGMKECTPG
jgi:hypothetical protein